MKICVLGLKASNCKSVFAALSTTAKFECKMLKVQEIRSLEDRACLIIPGVGHISSLSKEIERHYTASELKNIVYEKNLRIIGICLGFQYLCKSSSEDPSIETLGIFDFAISPLSEPIAPSVGWKRLHNWNCGFDVDLPTLGEQGFYFTHSYGAIIHPSCSRPSSCDWLYCYDHEKASQVVAAVRKENFIGFQFHPEKSGSHGLRLLHDAVRVF